MKRAVLIMIAASIFLCSCNARMERKAKEKYEQEAKARADALAEEWKQLEKLFNLAVGVTSSVKDERKEAYVKLIQKVPDLSCWEEIDNSIEYEKTYSKHKEALYELKKLKGIPIDY